MLNPIYCEQTRPSCNEGRVYCVKSFSIKKNLFYGIYPFLADAAAVKCDGKRIAAQHHEGDKPRDAPFAVGVGSNQLSDVSRAARAQSCGTAPPQRLCRVPAG